MKEAIEINKLAMDIQYEVEHADRTRPHITLFDSEKTKVFTKYFDTEFQRDKFLRKLKHSDKLKAIPGFMVNYYE